MHTVQKWFVHPGDITTTQAAEDESVPEIISETHSLQLSKVFEYLDWDWLHLERATNQDISSVERFVAVRLGASFRDKRLCWVHVEGQGCLVLICVDEKIHV